MIYNGNNEYLVRLFDAGDHDILFSAFVKGEELARALTGNLGKCGFVAYPVDSGGDA